MPVFFLIMDFVYAIEGYIERKNLKNLMRTRFIQLVIPYMFFEAVILALSLLSSQVFGLGHIDLIKAIKSIIFCKNVSEYPGINNRLWFLPVAFIASLISYCLKKLSKNKTCILVTAATLMLILSYISTTAEEGLLWMFALDISFLASFYILVGYLVKKMFYSKIRCLPVKVKCITLLCSGMAYLLCVMLNSGVFFMFINQYGDYFGGITGSLFGAVAFLLFVDTFLEIVPSILYLWIKDAILWFNKNSLVIFPVHLILLFYVTKIVESNYWAFPLRIVGVCILQIPIIQIFNKKFPVLAGKRR